MNFDFTSLADEELLSRVKSGCEQSHDVLFTRHYRTAFAFAYRMCGNRDVAEEVTQEAMIRAARGLKSFKGDSKFSTWLYRITLNTLYDQKKRQGKREQLQERYTVEVTHDDSNEPNEADQADERSQQVLQALEILTEKEREVVVLTVYQNQSHADAAKTLGCAETTVSWRMFRAKQKIRRFITGKEHI